MKGIKQIKHYKLLREIGKGATGIVYEAIDEVNHKLVAIKSIPTSKMSDKRILENFKRELKLLHGLNHNNIIKITAVEKTVNNLYLILEYCNGGNLYEYSYFYRNQNKTPLPERHVQKILRQLIEGLEYMHKCKTVHRDIKLENILLNFKDVTNSVVPGQNITRVDYHKNNLDEEFQIKIADLGYARELEGTGVASTICGTPITMAPEVIDLFEEKSKDQKYNEIADLWSLGAITYELLIGQPPFYATNYKSLFEEVMKGRYNLPKNIKISIEAITFINGLLQFYPEKRMNWIEIRNHPFITIDSNNFHFLDLNTVDSELQSPEHLKLNAKDCNNFLWILFKNTKYNLHLDKVDARIYHDPIYNVIKNDNNYNSEGEYEEANELNLNNNYDIVTNNDDKPKEEQRVFDKLFSQIKEEMKKSNEVEIAKKKEEELRKEIEKEREQKEIEELKAKLLKEKKELELKYEAQQKEVERREAEKREIEIKEALKKEQERIELERKEAERKESERKEAERKNQEKKEAERKEAERKEAVRIEAERKEAERKEAEREEAVRIEAERKEAERKEAEREEAERIEAEKKEAERKEAERKVSETKELEKINQERQEAEKLKLDREKIEKLRLKKSQVNEDDNHRNEGPFIYTIESDPVKNTANVSQPENLLHKGHNKVEYANDKSPLQNKDNNLNFQINIQSNTLSNFEDQIPHNDDIEAHLEKVKSDKVPQKSLTEPIKTNQGVSIENISGEMTSLINSLSIPNKQRNVSEDYVEVPTTPIEEEEMDESLWEIISTTSIFDRDEVQCNIIKDDSYDVINEYFN